MRRELKLEPNEGDRRVIQRFLLLPMWLSGEFRWLEKANILMRYQHHTEIGCVWDMIKFEDKITEKILVKKSNVCNVVFVLNFIAFVIGTICIASFVSPLFLIVVMVLLPLWFLPTLMSYY